VQLLKEWMAQEERGTVWIARKVGRTKAYISHVLHGRFPLTDKLARDLQAKLGIPLPENRLPAREGSKKPIEAKKQKSREPEHEYIAYS
jgi:homoserine trans-succinylase